MPYLNPRVALRTIDFLARFHDEDASSFPMAFPEVLYTQQLGKGIRIRRTPEAQLS